MRRVKRALTFILAASIVLSCAACGGEGPSAVENGKEEGPGAEIDAASMWLVKTEGNVAVTDGEGADVSLIDRLGLYSGYGVTTKAASYGWIDLDDVKLTKMDESSDIEVEKEGRPLTLTVNSGAIFFNVTKPLEADETFKIRSSTIVTAIRGTCGWVEVPEADRMNVYILEGAVECSVGAVTETVAAGESAAISAAEETIEIGTFAANDSPAFVTSEVEGDDALAEEITDASGIDFLGTGDPVKLAMTRYRQTISRAETYEYGVRSTASSSQIGRVPTGRYRYALVQIAPEDIVPALILEQHTTDDLYFARVFMYDVDSGAVVLLSTVNLDGLDTVSGFDNVLAIEGDGQGLALTTTGPTSAVNVVRVTREDESLKYEIQWAGTAGEDTGITTLPIQWYDASDLSALGSWTPPAVEDTALPQDGDRLVLTGTLDEFTYDETVALQGVPDPNAMWADTSRTYWIILLDEPQTLEIMSGGELALVTGETSMIAIHDPSGIEQYAGQHIIFSIDPHMTFWPSDTSMPVGSARTDDIHVLS